MRKFLEKLINSKEARAQELRELIKKSEDVNEVRSLGDTLQAVLDELADAKAQLEELDEPASGEDGQRAQAQNLAVLATRTMPSATPNKKVDPLDTEEYREAFMNFCTRGIAIPKELRADEITKTSDTSAVIPTTIMNEIVTELKSYGSVYNQVRKLNVQGGVEIPILSLKPSATWISADTGTSESDKQKLQANTKISFSYFGLECKVAQTLLVNVTTLEMFQSLFVPLATEAIVQALEIAIFNGTGSGQPTGITKDSRVPAANIVTLSASDIASWTKWKKNVFAKMKKSYRDGKFFMAQATFDGYIDGMVDTNGQPIGRVNYGIDGEENYRFGGKTVETVENDVIEAYDDAATDDVIAVFFKPSDYAINSNLEMQVVKWIDNDTNEVKNKVIMICDGKLVDPNGVIIIKKGA